jgi:hypothetical protein
MSIRNNYAADPALALLLTNMEKEKRAGGSVRPQAREKITIQNPSITQDRRKTEPKNTYTPISISKPQTASSIKPDPTKINISGRTSNKNLFDDDEQDSINALQRTIDHYSGADFNEDLISVKPRAISIDPALLEAQKAAERKPAAISIDPALLEAQMIIDNYQNTGMIDPALLDAEKWSQFLLPELYPEEGNSVDVTPGDDGKDNPYGIDVNEFLRWAYSQLGYREKASNENLDDKLANPGKEADNWTKYGAWYDDYKNSSGFSHDAWCAMLASWCANKAGIPDDKITKTASTGAFVNWYKKEGRFESNDSRKYEPSAGDLIFYQWTNTDGSTGGHTGIVIAYKDGFIYTIEGNRYDDIGVYFRKVPIDKENISGFGVNGGNSSGIIPPNYRT